jgi:uncharacterized protein
MAKYLLLLPIIISISFGCKMSGESDFNDQSKRNEDWVWFIDSKTQKGNWLRKGKETTVTDGTATSFYFNGMIYSIAKLKNGILVDTIKRYDLKGNLELYLIMNDNREPDWYFLNDGDHVSYFPNGKILTIGNIINHKIGNRNTSYFENGRTLHSWNILSNPGYLYEYYENGNHKLKQIGEMELDTPTNKWTVTNGLVVDYYENGQIKDSTKVVNKNPDGDFYSFYEGGKQKSIGFFRGGKLNGEAKNWYQNGKLKNAIKYLDNNLTGKTTSYYENGRVKDEVNYVNGVLNGTATLYDTNGIIKEKRNYLNGIKMK